MGKIRFRWGMAFEEGSRIKMLLMHDFVKTSEQGIIPIRNSNKRSSEYRLSSEISQPILRSIQNQT
jgi:hypothetical protein